MTGKGSCPELAAEEDKKLKWLQLVHALASARHNACAPPLHRSGSFITNERPKCTAMHR